MVRAAPESGGKGIGVVRDLMAAVFSKVLGEEVTYAAVPLDVLRARTFLALRAVPPVPPDRQAGEARLLTDTGYAHRVEAAPDFDAVRCC